jgi:hypothetical protein
MYNQSQMRLATAQPVSISGEESTFRKGRTALMKPSKGKRSGAHSKKGTPAANKEQISQLKAQVSEYAVGN